ncbi:hypothetical protein N9V13_00835 [Betaproteobacteria bacterium]|nr:hypothetical protein [Betaproteobacteria bacterium]
MKILFQRRSISYSIKKIEVTRVMRGEELDSIFEAVFMVRILGGHPTLLLEPSNLFQKVNYAGLSPWTKPNYIFILQRDGDAGRAIFVDSFDRRLVYD